jgi:hypothetical protein
MTTKPFNRRSLSKKRTREVTSAESLAKLYDIPRYDRNELTLNQINRLRELIDLKGMPSAVEFTGIGENVLLRVCAGFGHRLKAKNASKVREFLSGNTKK